MADDDVVDDDGALIEYQAVVEKVDAAVAAAFALAADAVACARGCHSCCAPGLTVLPVEAEAIARHLEHHDVRGRVMAHADRCAFLDSDGACSIYDARPILCRTHGLPLRMTAHEERRGLRILEDVSVCELNFRERQPRPDEVLDAERVLALLFTVDRRFRALAGLDDDGARVPLAVLADM